MKKLETGWPRFGSWRFRFVPVRFIDGSVRERFVVDRFGSVRFLRKRGSVRFGSQVVRFVAVRYGSLRFVVVCYEYLYIYKFI